MTSWVWLHKVVRGEAGIRNSTGSRAGPSPGGIQIKPRWLEQAALVDVTKSKLVTVVSCMHQFGEGDDKLPFKWMEYVITCSQVYSLEPSASYDSIKDENWNTFIQMFFSPRDPVACKGKIDLPMYEEYGTTYE